MLLPLGLLVMWCDKNKHQGCIAVPHCKCSAHPAQHLAQCPVLSHILNLFFPSPFLAGAAPLLPSRQGEAPRQAAGLGGELGASSQQGRRAEAQSWQLSAAGQPRAPGWPFHSSGVCPPWEMTGWVISDVSKSH